MGTFRKACNVYNSIERTLRDFSSEEDIKTLHSICADVEFNVSELFSLFEDLNCELENAIEENNKLEERIYNFSRKTDLSSSLYTEKDIFLVKSDNESTLDIIFSTGCDSLGLRYVGFNIDDCVHKFAIVNKKFWTFAILKYGF